MRNRRIGTNAALTLCVLGLMGAAAQLEPLRAAEQGSNSVPGIERPDSGETDGSELATPGKDGTRPAPSSTPNKEDRADVLDGEAPLADPASREEVLNGLYDELRAAKDAAAAEPITESIEEAWRNSGSDTVDLLMSRVDNFVLEADLDLALQVLDAVTEIAPDDAEAWHQRGIVNLVKKNYADAFSDLRHALAIDPKHYKAIRDLGVVLQQTGDRKGALEAFRRALEVDPFLDQARQAAEQLSRELEGQDI